MLLDKALRTAAPRHRPLPLVDRLEISLLGLLSQSTGRRPAFESQEQFLYRSIASDADLRTLILCKPRTARQAATRMPIQARLIHEVLDRILRDEPLPKEALAA